MSGEDQKVSVTLAGGIDDRGQSELRAPLLLQGQAPTLVQSVNTRLSRVRGTPVRAPGIASISGTGAAGLDCHGVVVSEIGQAAVEFFAPGDQGAGLGTRAIYAEGVTANGGSTEILRWSQFPSYLKTIYLPTEVEPFPALQPGYGISQQPAVAHDVTNGRLWFAMKGADSYVYAYVIDTSGRMIAPLQQLFIESAAAWIGLTWHGANGFYCWYQDGTGMRKRNLTLSGSLITVGAETAVYSPAATDAADVCRIDDTSAAILGTSASSPDDAVLRKHNVTSGAETTVTLTNAALGTTTFYSVACETIPSLAAARIAIAVSRQGTPLTTSAVYDTDLVAIWGPTTDVALPYGPCAVRFQDNVDGAHAVVAVSDTTGSFAGGTDTVRTTFRARTLAAGTAGASYDVYWMVLANRGAQLLLETSTLMYPTFFLQRAYGGPTAQTVASDDYVDDPDIEAWLVNETPTTSIRVAPIARFGCVRGNASPARALPAAFPSSSGAVGVGSSVYCMYLTDQSGVGMEYFAPRVTGIHALPKTLRVAHDKGGVAIAAGGLPFQWDSVDVTELGGPLFRPHLKIATTGGSGAVFPAGVYSFLVHYECRDAAGQRHRTRISNIVTMTATGTEQPVLTVTTPTSTLFDLVNVLVFGTTANGITYHQLPIRQTGTFGDILVFGNIPVPLLESPQVYSTGEAGQELMPQPPAPLADVAIVGARAWGIDAEVRSRAVHSKLRIAGIGYEWHPALEVNFPAGGGQLRRVFELSGVPVFVAERATYYVTGEGPDNTGAGGFFSAPTKVSEHGCSNPHALCWFPGGAVWQDSDRWVVMRGLQTAYDESVSADFDAVGTILLRRSSEAVFVNRNGGAKVYNYELNRWTTWDTSAVVATAITANAPYNDNIAYLYSPDNGALYKLTDGTYTAASTMALQTDVLLPSGDFQDHLVLQRVVFRAERTGQHALTMSLYTNESSSATTSRTWTSGEIDSYLDAAGCYVVTLEPVEQDTRGVRIRIADDTTGFGGAGMRPIALTLVWGVEDSMVYEEQFRVDTQRK